MMKKRTLSYSLILLSVLGTSSLSATSLKDAIEDTIKHNKEIQKIEQEAKANKYSLEANESSYYPKVNLDAKIGNKNTKDSPEGGTATSTSQSGYNLSLDIEQLLYSANVNGQVEEAKAQYELTSADNKNQRESVILKSVFSYLNLLESKEKKELQEILLNKNLKYKKIAKDKETISNNSLDLHQANSKYYNTLVNLDNENKNSLVALNEYEKNIGKKLNDSICRPQIESNKIVTTKEKFLTSTLETNLSLKSSQSELQKQKGSLEKVDGNYYPTLKLRGEYTLDDNLLNNDAQTNIYSAMIELDYTLYDGNRSANYNKEKLLLKSIQNKHEYTKQDIENRINASYDEYLISRKNIANLKENVKALMKVLSTYKTQHDNGSRSFIDLLNAEVDLNSARTRLISEEFRHLRSYYTLLYLNGTLESNLLNSKGQFCKGSKIKVKQIENKPKFSKELKAVFEDNAIVLNASLKEGIAKEFADEIRDKIVVFNKKTMTLKLPNLFLGYKKSNVVLTSENKILLRNTIPKLLNILNKYEDEIKTVKVVGYSLKGSTANSSKKNRRIAYQRAKKVQNYIDQFIAHDSLKNKFSSYSALSSSSSSKIHKRVEFTFIENK